MFINRSKLYYTASGIITPVGGRPVHRLREDSQSVHSKWLASLDREYETNNRVQTDGLRNEHRNLASSCAALMD